MSEPSIAKRLSVNGIVQGVGFRPFVYQLARRHGVRGSVANTGSGVSIHLEGAGDRIDAFCRDLTDRPPPLARITEVAVSPEVLRNPSDFRIIQSRSGAGRATLISPDVSVCDDCLDELFDPDDRRYRYPFINCTNCGPRYTIIDDIPYDRPHTSMRGFPMCSACRAEYEDPEDRRFHAQPNACPVCGPHVALVDAGGRPMEAPDPIARAAELLAKGAVVAVKGLGGFHLAADAGNPAAVARLRSRKVREEKPLALMCPNLPAVHQIAEPTVEEAVLLASPQRPIVLLKKREDGPIADAVSPRNRYFGVMLPYTPLHHLLFDAGVDFTALVMTSGNRSDEPIAIDNGEATDRLSGIADAFLVHDRDIVLRSDDAIVRRAAGAIRPIRRSRGYVPVPVFLDGPRIPVLACGAELKNTVCLTRGDQAFLSQHVGDLSNLAAEAFFEQTIDHLKRILDIEPALVAHDLHPDYLSTRYARELPGIPRQGVQHHHAHITSCMAENRIQGPVIGLAFDGAGYGPDGAVWGGEVLIAGLDRFRRAGHLSYVGLPGGDAAAKEPWRMAVSHLHDAFGDDLPELDPPLLSGVDPARRRFVLEMVQKGVHCPPTSSLGRLFDGAAALLGLRDRAAFEGQAAMELEMIADPAEAGVYDGAWEPVPGTTMETGVHRLPAGPIIRGMVRDLADGVPRETIAGRFHKTLIRRFSDLCGRIREAGGPDRVALSGGAFQNVLLLTGFIETLEGMGFTVFTHTQVPANDGGIALGQAVAAAAIHERTVGGTEEG